jgi:hypothetical protein
MPDNTTRDQDHIISRAHGAPTMDELVDIISYLDNSLTDALERIVELEARLEE